MTCDTVVESGAIVIDSCEDNLTIDAGLVEGMQCIQTCEDHAVSFTVDVPSGQTILSFTQTANGTVTDNGDGTFTYTPTTNYFGSDTFTYTLGTTTTVTKTSDVPTSATEVSRSTRWAITAPRRISPAGTLVATITTLPGILPATTRVRFPTVRTSSR